MNFGQIILAGIIGGLIGIVIKFIHDRKNKE